MLLSLWWHIVACTPGHALGLHRLSGHVSSRQLILTIIKSTRLHQHARVRKRVRVAPAAARELCDSSLAAQRPRGHHDIIAGRWAIQSSVYAPRNPYNRVSATISCFLDAKYIHGARHLSTLDEYTMVVSWYYCIGTGCSLQGLR